MPAGLGFRGAPARRMAHESRRPLQPWQGIRWVPETGSTNADLVSALRQPDAEQTWQHLQVLGTDLQTAGKGRLDRGWQAPSRAALSFSMVLRPELPAHAYPWLTPLAALAICRILSRAGVHARIKWPNDVLAEPAAAFNLDGAGADRRSAGEPKKVCGILAQTVPTAGGVAVVLGVGLNVSQAAEELPVSTATSLYLAGSSCLDRSEILRSYLAEFTSLLAGFVSSGGDPDDGGPVSVRAQVTDAMSTIGASVRAELPGGETVVGTAARLDRDGSLVVRTSDGRERAISAADVVHLRKVRPGGDGDAY